MTRILIVTLFLIFCAPPLAHAETSSADPTNQGYVETKGDDAYKTFPPTKWEQYKSECKKCQPLVDSYNAAMQELFNARAALAQIKDVEASLERLSEEDNTEFFESLVGYSEKGLGDKGAFVGIMADMREDMTKIVKQKAPMEELIANLEFTTKDLRTQITVCEEQCKLIGDENYIIGSLGTPPEDRTPSLPFDWKGPYQAACEKCEALTLRLNQLPALALQNLAELDATAAKIGRLRIEQQLIKTRGIYVHDNKETNARKKSDLKKLDKLGRELASAENLLKRQQNDYEAIKKNFTETLKAHKDCNNSCEGKEPIKEPTKTSCAPLKAGGSPAIAIGPNDQFGSGAAFQDKLEGQAKGAAMGALNSVLGGSGISLGGGGDKKDKGPKEVKDPTKSAGDFVVGNFGGTEIGVRSAMTNDGLVVSSKIENTPGDGTFHAQWIEDGYGNVYLPKEYLIFSLYQDWKLTVWWDYKRWQDNELVEHDYGEEVSFGTDHLGDWMVSLSGPEKSIWGSMGFATAKKGLNGLGTLYDIPDEVLEGGCPLRIVNHISLPDGDPVMTQPTYTGLKFGKDGWNSPRTFLIPGVDDPDIDDY